MSYTYEYPRPAVTADIVLFSNEKSETEVMLIRRKNPPFEGMWAFPGGFLEMDETLLACAHRELEEETGVKDIDLTPYLPFDAPDRDPRGRTISMVFAGFTNASATKATAASDASEVQWFPLNNLPSLAFDHDKIIRGLKQKYAAQIKK